jgi:hypothetical protein
MLRIAGNTLHRVRDTQAVTEGKKLRPCVPRMLRSAPRLRRGALLIRGPSFARGVVPALRRIAKEALHRVRDTSDIMEQIARRAID